MLSLLPVEESVCFHQSILFISHVVGVEDDRVAALSCSTS